MREIEPGSGWFFMTSRKRPSIIIATPDPAAEAVLQKCMASNYTVDAVSEQSRWLEVLQSRRYEFIFVDVRFLARNRAAHPAANDVQRSLGAFVNSHPTANIVILCPPQMIRDAVYAVKAGASDYLSYPISPDEVRYITENIYENRRKQSELDYLRDQFREKDAFDIFETQSLLMRSVYDKIRSVAPTRTTVMLLGETGVGKGVMAGLIHSYSNRKDQQFISVHCGAIPDTLLESELFGHEKGAFTGAVRRKLGKFEIAHGGTIFLDEIGTISAAAQIKMLQVLQDRSFQRLGGQDVFETDARIIAATNTDLKKMSVDGYFRKDLFYRLNVFPIEIPALRERKEDIPHLTAAFLKRLNLFYAKGIGDVHPLVMEALQTYEWPGNIRELENLVERSYILEKSTTLTPESFPSELFASDVPITPFKVNPAETLAEVRRRGIENLERQYLKEVLARTRGRIDRSAQTAGVSTRQLRKLLAKYAIRKEDFKQPEP